MGESCTIQNYNKNYNNFIILWSGTLILWCSVHKKIIRTSSTPKATQEALTDTGRLQVWQRHILCFFAGDLADLIFVFFDPIGQALCKRTLNVVEELSSKHADRMRFYLSKVSNKLYNNFNNKVSSNYILTDLVKATWLQRQFIIMAPNLAWLSSVMLHLIRILAD